MTESALRRELANYLTMRRALGYRLVRPEKLLIQFCDFLQFRGEELITIASAICWAGLTEGGSNWRAYRLSAVRGFARYLHGFDPAHQVPPPDLVPHKPQRAVPYLYSQTEITALMNATKVLGTKLRRATFFTLIGLLAVTGMRVGEAIGLNRADVDLGAGRITIRYGKFAKTRELALHSSTVEAMRAYLRCRDRLVPRAQTTSFFVSMAGTRLLYCNVHVAWKQIRDAAGLNTAIVPRIHDLRHAFSVRAMLEAYADGQDGQMRLTLLSTWLGHVDPKSTYWYLTASPELMAAAAGRLETYLQDWQGGVS